MSDQMRPMFKVFVGCQHIISAAVEGGGGGGKCWTLICEHPIIGRGGSYDQFAPPQTLLSLVSKTWSTLKLWGKRNCNSFGCALVAVMTVSYWLCVVGMRGGGSMNGGFLWCQPFPAASPRQYGCRAPPVGRWSAGMDWSRIRMVFVECKQGVCLASWV